MRVQFQEDLAVLKPVRQQVGDVHRERGLPHSGHAVDGVNGYDPTGARLCFNRLDQTRQFLLATGKSDSVAWQRPRRSRDSAAVRLGPIAHGQWLVATAAGGCLETRTTSTIQLQCIGQQARCIPPRRVIDPPFQVAD